MIPLITKFCIFITIVNVQVYNLNLKAICLTAEACVILCISSILLLNVNTGLAIGQFLSNVFLSVDRHQEQQVYFI